MNSRLFALIGATLLAGLALGPAMAAAQSTDAGNAPAESATSFGEQVSTFVHDLQTASNGTGIGDAVSSFVVANNPGNAPAWAGSPGGPNATDADARDNATDASNATQRGPPAFVTSLIGGPFAQDDGLNETDGPPHNGTGVPAHAGGPDKDADSDEAGPADDSDAASEASEDGGPPEHAGGANGNGPAGN